MQHHIFTTGGICYGNFCWYRCLKDKHDCFIVSSEGEVLADVFTIPNNMDGFHCLLQKIQACAAPQDKIKSRA